MKNSRWVKLILALQLMVIPAPQFAAEKALRIKLATLAPRGSMYHRVLQEIGETWQQAEGVDSKFIVYPDGSQGGEHDVVRRMRIGQLNAAMMTVVGLSAIDVSVSGLQKLPMVFRSWDELDHVSRVLHPRIEKRFEQKGYKILFWGEAGWVRFFSTTPAAHPDDLKKRRLFAWAGDNEQVNMTRTLGFQPIVLETEDIIPGLQTGLIDTVPVTAMWALATQVDQIASHMIDLKWVPVVFALVMTRKTWDSISPAGQVALLRASAQATGKLRAHQMQAEEKALQVMVTRGLKIQRLSPEDVHAWQQLSKSALHMIRGSTVPTDEFDAVMQLLAEFRQSNRSAEE